MQVHGGTHMLLISPFAPVLQRLRQQVGWECTCCKSGSMLWLNYSFSKYSRLIIDNFVWSTNGTINIQTALDRKCSPALLYTVRDTHNWNLLQLIVSITTHNYYLYLTNLGWMHLLNIHHFTFLCGYWDPSQKLGCLNHTSVWKSYILVTERRLFL